MQVIATDVFDRCLAKTPEGVLASRLQREFEFSPAVGVAICELARECLLGEIPPTPGKLVFFCVSRKACHGMPLTQQMKVRVVLTLVSGADDVEVFRDHGPGSLRRQRVLRLTDEAYGQGGLLTQEDLALLLHVSSRTIRNDVQALIAVGFTVHTRGYDHDIGRGTSHKTRIVDLFLAGLTYDEMMRRTRHSASAIRRYVTTFGRMLLLIEKGITSTLALSRILQQSERLTLEYQSLYEKYLVDGTWPSAYEELVDQLRALNPVEKKESTGGGINAID